MDFVVGIEIKLSGNHTCLGSDGKPHPFYDICDELQGKYPKDFKFTGWHPHCRCFATPILKTWEEMAADDERILSGEEPTTESVNTVRDMPDKFKQWTEANQERIDRAKSLPYFIKDNGRYFNIATQEKIRVLYPAATIITEPTPLTILQRAEARHAARTPEQVQAIQQAWNEDRDYATIQNTALVDFNGKEYTIKNIDIASVLTINERYALETGKYTNVRQDVIVDKFVKSIAKNNQNLFNGGLNEVVIINNTNPDAPFMSNTRWTDGTLLQNWVKEKGNRIEITRKNFYKTDPTDGIQKRFNPAENVIGAIRAILVKEPLTFNQEYALESLWHEIRHAGSTGWKQYINYTAERRTAMETINQFCSRLSYSRFIESIGGKAIHQKHVLASGYGYSTELKNFQNALKSYNISHSVAFVELSTIIQTEKYERMDYTLRSFFVKHGVPDDKAIEIVSNLDSSSFVFDRILKNLQ